MVRCVAVEYGRAERGRLGLLGYATAALGPSGFGWAGGVRLGKAVQGLAWQGQAGEASSGEFAQGESRQIRFGSAWYAL